VRLFTRLELDKKLRLAFEIDEYSAGISAMRLTCEDMIETRKLAGCAKALRAVR
jgi:hypothetical protein